MNGLPAKSGPKVGKKKVDDDPPRFCTRIGCSGRIKYARNADDIATIFRRTPPPPVKKPDPRTTKPLQQTRSSARSSASSSSSSSENRRSVNGGKSAVVERSPLESNSVVKKTTKKKKKEIHSEPETSSSSSKAVASAARNDNAAASTSRARPPSGIDRAAPNGRPYRSDRRADPAVASSALTRGSPMFRLDDIGGATEILLALERIEQDEDLTHEQVVALEMSLFLTGLSLYDQYRDMRLDIDHMSYEVLLFSKFTKYATPICFS
ncbi:hypothetical protein M569_09581 [Genlisea aurea]|uniref:Uncharacterized protein n=1 Tax=Genlisea aurea TaxID=192259 RepID=S8DYS3_9LAMI|nr:hypothetical protein M569_09581 [Genlisea aurea]